MELAELVKIWEVVQVFHRYTTLQKVILVIGTPVALYVVYLATIGRPPLIVYELRFFLLQDRQVRSLNTGGQAFELEFRLVNSTSPPAEVHNVFGQIWFDGTYFLTSTIPATRGQAGDDRVEWDLQLPVFPKEGFYLPTKILVSMPPPNREVLVGAQFVSGETQREEYLWKIANDNGVPTTVVLKAPRTLE